jgi:hypothetical protein
LVAVVLVALAATPAYAEGVALSDARKAFLEGEWHGVTIDTNANKLCTEKSPPATVITFEFARTGGLSYFDNGVQEESGRKFIVSASESGDLVKIQFEGQGEPWAFRQDGPERMAVVRHSASLGMDVDTMAFKRCKGPADRSAMTIDDTGLKALGADMPKDQPYFVDARIAAKVKDACNAARMQYVFFSLVGPSEFRVSRWNSFDLGDALTQGKKAPYPLDPVGDWTVIAAAAASGGYIFELREREKPNDAAIPLHVTLKDKGAISIAEWKRNYVRCTGFDKRG